jgi:hypothetical protein
MSSVESHQLPHLRLPLRQPEPHVPLAIHRRDGGEVLLRLLTVAPFVGTAGPGRGGSGQSGGACHAARRARVRGGRRPHRTRRRTGRDGSRCRRGGAGLGRIPRVRRKILARARPGCAPRRAGRAAGRRDPASGGAALTCLEHLWQFDLRTGAPMGDAQEGVKGHRLKEERGEIYVGLEG